MPDYRDRQSGRARVRVGAAFWAFLTKSSSIIYLIYNTFSAEAMAQTNSGHLLILNKPSLQVTSAGWQGQRCRNHNKAYYNHYCTKFCSQTWLLFPLPVPSSGALASVRQSGTKKSCGAVFKLLSKAVTGKFVFSSTVWTSWNRREHTFPSPKP